MKNILVAALLMLAGNTLVSAQPQGPEPQAGRDYAEIPNGRPLEAHEGKIVIEEFFNYICPACNSFELQFSTWAAELPSYAVVEHVPASFRADFVPYARAYYAAKFFDVNEESHQAAYDAIHLNRTLPAEGQRPDEERIAEFYADYGVDPEEFLDTMHSFSVESKVRQAAKHMQDTGARQTPALVINGRYIVQGTSFAEMLRISSYLIEKEHAAAQ